MVERQLTDSVSHIVRMSHVAAEMKANGRDSAKAESSLRVSVMIQELFEDFRLALLAKREREEGGL
jgi:hypothetical protein